MPRCTLRGKVKQNKQYRTSTTESSSGCGGFFPGLKRGSRPDTADEVNSPTQAVATQLNASLSTRLICQ